MRLVLPLFLLLSSCAHYTLTQSQCEQARWEELGRENALQGFAPDFVENHVEACAQYQKRVDRKLYAKGWKEGLAGFCTLERAYSHGLMGAAYHGLCPKHIHSKFQAAYERGKQEHQASIGYIAVPPTDPFSPPTPFLSPFQDPSKAWIYSPEASALAPIPQSPGLEPISPYAAPTYNSAVSSTPSYSVIPSPSPALYP
jgi:hypothetical protein